MNNSFTSPKPISSDLPLVCPPAPRGRKPSVTFNGKHIVVPLYFPGSCSILARDDSNVIATNDNPSHNISNRPAADFTLKNRQANSEDVPTRRILIGDFPTLPFSFPASTNQAAPAHPASSALSRTNSDPNKLKPFKRRGSITDIEHRRTSFNARCA